MRLDAFLNSPDRRVGISGVLLCACCLAYFYLLEAAVFSSHGFTSIFRELLLLYDSQTAWLCVLVCALAAAWNGSALVLRLVDFLGQRYIPCALAVVVMVCLGTLFIYQNYALCMDEYAAVFQSKIFASGHLFAQFPASVVDWLIVPGFNGQFLIASAETGRAIEMYLPGFALLLAPFQAIGAPWLCNALLAGFSVLLVHRITLRLTNDPRAAGWAVLFALASSTFWANAISYYSMQAHMTANLLFALLLLEPTPRRCLAAGLVGSVAVVLHNPYPHALFALPWIAALGLKRAPRLLPLGVGYLPGLAVAAGWLWLRQDIGRVAHPDVGALVATGLFMWPDAELLSMRAAALVKMWVWAMPCLFAFACLGWWRWRDHRNVRLLALSAMTTFCGYLFIKLDQGHGWGYRYFESAWGAVPILAACALSARCNVAARLVSFAGAAAVLSALVLVPFQLTQIGGFIAQHRALIPAPVRPGNNVYFIDPRAGWYIVDAIQADPLLRSPDLLLFSRGRDLNQELIRENWPDAIDLHRHGGVAQWSLGPVDRRISPSGRAGDRRFSIRFTGAELTPPKVPASDPTPAISAGPSASIASLVP